MHVYGIIQRSRLVVVGQGFPGAKPVVYEDVPAFDQCTQYVRQQEPIDVGSHIFAGAEVMEMVPMDEFDTDPDGAPY